MLESLISLLGEKSHRSSSLSVTHVRVDTPPVRVFENQGRPCDKQSGVREHQSPLYTLWANDIITLPSQRLCDETIYLMNPILEVGASTHYLILKPPSYSILVFLFAVSSFSFLVRARTAVPIVFSISYFQAVERLLQLQLKKWKAEENILFIDASCNRKESRNI